LDEPESRPEIAREARRRLRAIRGNTAPPVEETERRPRREPRLLNEAEERRARAFSNYVAEMAGGDRGIEEFRTRVLGGRLLSRPGAVELLGSEAPRYMSLSDFGHELVPLVGHGMKAESKYKTEPAPFSEKKGPKARPLWRHEVDLAIQWDSGSKRILRIRDYPEGGPGKDDETSIYLTADGEGWVPQVAWQGSVFYELARLSDRLASSFPWLQEQATMFILTGEAPFVSPLLVDPPHWRLGSYAYVRLTVHVEPWVSVESVARLFRHLQMGALPKRSRAIGEKHLSLLEFVTKHSQSGDDVPSFEILLQLWNKSHPRWKYSSAWRFARDYRRVGQNIVFPPYTMFSAKGRTKGAKTKGR